jgi:hypothetical protein
MSGEPLVGRVEEVLLGMARRAATWEEVRRLAWVGECFDGGDFDVAQFETLRYRLDLVGCALMEWRPDARVAEFSELVDACQAVLDAPRTRERNLAISCGNLRRNEAPVLAPRECPCGDPAGGPPCRPVKPCPYAQGMPPERWPTPVPPAFETETTLRGGLAG